MNTFARIIGTGRYLPNAPISNQDLVDRLAKAGIETSDEWIRERSGITQRHWASENETVSEMSTHASLQALEMAKVKPEELDLILLATSSSDVVMPSASCRVQAKIGATNAACMDLIAACTGFVFALTVANSMIKSGQAKTVLVIGADAVSHFLNEQDRTTAVLFGDGAGAVVVRADEQTGILSSKIHSDGTLENILFCDARMVKGQLLGTPHIQMEGQSVFKHAVGSLSDVALEVLDAVNMSISDLDWLVPHQANIRIIQSIAKRLEVPMDKVICTVGEHGNTSAASVPLALDTAIRDGRIKQGDTLMLQGVGGGFNWGAILLEL